MKIGFTGTQNGMSIPQMDILQKLFNKVKVNGEFHHGDCIGADQQAHKIALLFKMKIYIHPPQDSKKRAWCSGPNVIILPVKDYLVRNKDIVNVTQVLIATPADEYEQLRSGVWSTIRYAKKIGKPIRIIYPSGQIQSFERINPIVPL